MHILLTGASGLIGSALIESLHGLGHTLRCLQRTRNTTMQDGIWDPSPLVLSENETGFDAVIHLAGENVAAGRWSAARKKRILDSRINGTRELVGLLATLPTPPKTFLCASAIGFYGSRQSELLTETSGTGSGFLAEVCRHWEAEANKAKQQGMRVVNLRFGMVLSPHGGALHKMLPPFKAGVGGPIGNGKQYMSWISIRDLVAIVAFVLNTPSLQGPVNVVSPKPLTNRDFTSCLSKVLNRPALLPTPPFALKLLFGEMATEMLLASSRVKPEKLLRAGYSFQDTDLATTLEHCVTP